MLVQTYLDYERVVAYHKYRQDQPWDNGGALLVTMGREEPAIKAEEERLIRTMGAKDNHHGWTVSVVAEGHAHPVMLRFSDFKMSVWLMPPGWQDVGAVGGGLARLTGMRLCSEFHGDPSGRAWFDDPDPGRWDALAKKIAGML